MSYQTQDGALVDRLTVGGQGGWIGGGVGGAARVVVVGDGDMVMARARVCAWT